MHIRFWSGRKSNLIKLGDLYMPKQNKPVLYFAAGTRSTRPCWLLEELGTDYDLKPVNLRKGEQKLPPFLELNPMGKVPVLEGEDGVVTESLAICFYLADKYGLGKLPPKHNDPLRAAYYQWMSFSSGALEAAVIEEYRRRITERAGENFKPLTRQLSTFEDVMKQMESHLSKNSYLLGDEFSAADIVNGMGVVWAPSMNLTKDYLAVEKWLEKLEARPAYKAMLEKS